MQIGRQNDPAGAARPRPAELRWRQLAFWLAACSIHGAAVAWLAGLLERDWAPWFLFPALVGGLLGVTLAGSMRLCQVGNRTTILAGAGLAVVATVIGQHYYGYRAALAASAHDAATYRLAKQAFGEKVMGRIPVPPDSFVEFLRWQAAWGRPMPGNRQATGRMAWLSWAVDGLLVLAGALVVVVPASRRAFCDRCRSWFRTTRSGRIDASAARSLAEAAGIPPPPHPASARYRLISCNAGCGPTGFELSWVEGDRKSVATTVWLDVGRRTEIVRALDEQAEVSDH